MIRPSIPAATAVVIGILAITACGTGSTAGPTSPGGTPAAPGRASASTPSSSPGLSESTTLSVVTHDSFALTPALLDQFRKDTGYQLTMVAPGDAGTMVNQLILTKDSPLGDVVFGIDNTFSGRAISEGVLSPYTSPAAARVPAALAADDSGSLTPVDMGDVCLNADTAWFTQRGIALPVTLDDLVKPEYKDLLVVENPASSSPGLAFLIATVGAKGESGWLDYWGRLKANGVKVVPGWTEAYSVEFSGSTGRGTRPLVVSYSTSPAFEVPRGGGAPTSTALLQTCFRQVEYAGVIKGAANEVGARKFIDFLLSRPVQTDIPGRMYMYPATPGVELPADWRSYAPLADKPIVVAPQTIAANRTRWIKDWTARVLG